MLNSKIEIQRAQPICDHLIQSRIQKNPPRPVRRKMIGMAYFENNFCCALLVRGCSNVARSLRFKIANALGFARSWVNRRITITTTHYKIFNSSGYGWDSQWPMTPGDLIAELHSRAYSAKSDGLQRGITL